MQRKTSLIIHAIILGKINFKCFYVLYSFPVQNKMHNNIITLYISNSYINSAVSTKNVIN